MKQNIDKLKFTPISNEFLDNFKAPLTFKIYDYENDISFDSLKDII